MPPEALEGNVVLKILVNFRPSRKTTRNEKRRIRFQLVEAVSRLTYKCLSVIYVYGSWGFCPFVWKLSLVIDTKRFFPGNKETFSMPRTQKNASKLRFLFANKMVVSWSLWATIWKTRGLVIARRVASASPKGGLPESVPAGSV